MAPVIPLVRAASLVAVWLCAGVGWAAETTVSVYLPGYDASDWKALRGSVIKSVRKQSLAWPPFRAASAIPSPFAYAYVSGT